MRDFFKRFTLIEWAVIAAIVLILLSVVSSCNRPAGYAPGYSAPIGAAPMAAPAPAPVVVQQGGSNFVEGMLAGHVLTNMFNGPSRSSAPVVTEQPHLHQGQATVPPKPVTPATPAVAPKPAGNPYSSFSGAGKTYVPSPTPSRSYSSYSGGSRSYGGRR